MEQLINDRSRHVRKAVAYKGYNLEKLIDDKNQGVIDSVLDLLQKMRIFFTLGSGKPDYTYFYSPSLVKIRIEIYSGFEEYHWIFCW